MGKIFRIFLIGATSWIRYICISKYLALQSSKREKRRHNCGDAVKYPHKEPFFGLDLLIKDTKEHASCVYLKEIQPQFQVYGKTHEIHFLGERMIRTMEPENIQTVLGLNTKDYGLEPLREGHAMLLFGRGINTTDGEYWLHSRALIKHTFSRMEICDFISLEMHFSRLVDLIPRDGTIVDL